MKNLLTTAKLNWFSDGCCDVTYLDLWGAEPLNFDPHQPLDTSWHHDHYEYTIGHDISGVLFRAAAEKLLTYQFYPATVITPTSDFSLNKRRARLGDRIVQRVHLLKLFGYPILDVVTMTEITQLIDAPRQATLGYTTVNKHVEQGVWSASIRWSRNDLVMLSVQAISRPTPTEPTRNYRYMRMLQKHAHHQGIAYFIDEVTTAVSCS